MPKKNKKAEDNRQNERLPVPAEEGIEKSILGAILLDNERFYESTALGLRVEHFHFGWNKSIFTAVSEVLEAGVKADTITVVHYLESQGQLAAAGDVPYITSLLQGVPDTGAQIPFYVKALRDSHLRRELFWMGERLTKMAADPTDPIDLTLSGTHDELLRLQGDSQEKSITPVSEVTEKVLADIERMMSYDPYGTVGIPFGFPELDEVTTGMREGQLIAIGGFPASGKTSFAVDVGRKVAKTSIPVGIFSREMLKEEVIERVLTQESDIPYIKIRRPVNLSVSEFRLLQRTRIDMDKWPLFIDDAATHIHQMVPRAHLMIKKYKVRLLIFDYLQIIDAPGDKEYERVSYVADTLMSLAKSTGVPIIALSQLTRPEGKKGELNTVPTMGMLRSSGKIEQNSHLILMLYRPVDKESGEPLGEDMVIVAKQRAGTTGRVKAFFNRSFQRWEPRVNSSSETPKQERIFTE